jgi:hypothetical protein
MRRAIVCTTLIALIAATGCSVAGKWSLRSVDPSAARRDFPYETLTLERDGSFYAEAKEPVPRTASGTYRYENGVLALSERGGERNSFQAKMPSNSELRLERPWKDRVVIAQFERRE